MWRWRDWVIDAFNANMPFDRFTVEQLAGDLLPEPTLSQRIATGFNRNHRGNAENGTDPDEYQVEYAVTGWRRQRRSWMGLTLGCATLPRSQVRPDLAEGVLPVLRLLQQRLRPGAVLQVRQHAADRARADTRAAGALDEMDRQIAALQAKLADRDAEIEAGLAGDALPASIDEWAYADRMAVPADIRHCRRSRAWAAGPRRAAGRTAAFQPRRRGEPGLLRPVHAVRVDSAGGPPREESWRATTPPARKGTDCS